MARMGEKRKSCRVLAGNAKGKRRLERPGIRWRIIMESCLKIDVLRNID
jgi:hypothetical protein